MIEDGVKYGLGNIEEEKDVFSINNISIVNNIFKHKAKR